MKPRQPRVENKLIRTSPQARRPTSRNRKAKDADVAGHRRESNAMLLAKVTAILAAIPNPARRTETIMEANCRKAVERRLEATEAI
jgi:hypothetical protein